ncbi:hypothetical protein PISS_a1528 [Pseudoalteromonas issachenkonii]|uniref:Uncharacterized protein n=1 Tax=Pseudoalteromonas issachenkonii TaxID=152297 RepID=A0ABN5C0L6_9GAMM|nr:hypothetical protein PISS_a1528 [Pseudoalteromonas issachenkonii]ATD03025.1 hypothetical protein PTET_a1593 [Pseudoalteromonas tetraodonis]
MSYFSAISIYSFNDSHYLFFDKISVSLNINKVTRRYFIF